MVDITNEANLKELLDEVRQYVRKEVGTNLHYGLPITEDKILIWACYTAYRYLDAENWPSFNMDENMMLDFLEHQCDSVEVVTRVPGAIQVQLPNHRWWLMFDSRSLNSKAYIKNAVSPASAPKSLIEGIPVSLNFAAILPVMDRIFPQIAEAARETRFEKERCYLIKAIKKITREARKGV